MFTAKSTQIFPNTNLQNEVVDMFDFLKRMAEKATVCGQLQMSNTQAVNLLKVLCERIFPDEITYPESIGEEIIHSPQLMAIAVFLEHLITADLEGERAALKVEKTHWRYKDSIYAEGFTVSHELSVWDYLNLLLSKERIAHIRTLLYRLQPDNKALAPVEAEIFLMHYRYWIGQLMNLFSDLQGLETDHERVVNQIEN